MQHFVHKIVDHTHIFRILGRISILISFAILACIPVALYYHESVMPFLESALVLLCFIGLPVILKFGTNKIEFGSSREAIFLVLLVWVFVPLIGTLPYLFSHAIHSFVFAFFESMSGFTTTGASILTDIESLPKSVLFWRALTHWIGGIGVIVLVIVILPTLSTSTFDLFHNESSLDNKFRPRILSVVRWLIAIYVGLTTLEVIFLLLGGMSLFESVCHSFATLATGGFSPKNDSVASYSPYIQYVITVFMLLAGVNFVIFFYIIHDKARKVRGNTELKSYLLIITLAGLAITTLLFLTTKMHFEQSFRVAFFQVVSIVTCTGFATADYLEWVPAGKALMFGLMFVGGCTGSTAGGIKVSRHVIALKHIFSQFKRLADPRGVFHVKVNGIVLKDDKVNYIMGFILFYLTFFLIGTGVLVFSGLDIGTSAGSIATAMGGIGPGFGLVGPASNFACLSNFHLLWISFFMLLGRLEIITVVLVMLPSFWKP